jgi:hypothetical protein
MLNPYAKHFEEGLLGYDKSLKLLFFLDREVSHLFKGRVVCMSDRPAPRISTPA